MILSDKEIARMDAIAEALLRTGIYIERSVAGAKTLIYPSPKKSYAVAVDAIEERRRVIIAHSVQGVPQGQEWMCRCPDQSAHLKAGDVQYCENCSTARPANMSKTLTYCANCQAAKTRCQHCVVTDRVPSEFIDRTAYVVQPVEKSKTKALVLEDMRRDLFDKTMYPWYCSRCQNLTKRCSGCVQDQGQSPSNYAEVV